MRRSDDDIEMNLGEMYLVLGRVNATDLRKCPVVGFGIRSVRHLDSVTAVLLTRSVFSTE